jgi:hypothetical protein
MTTITELIEIAKNSVITEDRLIAHHERLKEFEKRCAKESKERFASREFLDRTYSNIED